MQSCLNIYLQNHNNVILLSGCMKFDTFFKITNHEISVKL